MKQLMEIKAKTFPLVSFPSFEANGKVEWSFILLLDWTNKILIID